VALRGGASEFSRAGGTQNRFWVLRFEFWAHRRSSVFSNKTQNPELRTWNRAGFSLRSACPEVDFAHVVAAGQLLDFLQDGGAVHKKLVADDTVRDEHEE
jgi:hypothetical protein